LYADDLFIIPEDKYRKYSGRKVFISRDKRFAYGVSGEEMIGKRRAFLERTIRHYLDAMYLTTISLDKVYQQMYKRLREQGIDDFPSMLWMTHDRAWKITADDQFEVTHVTAAVGTGSHYALGRLATGIDPLKAMQGVHELDHLTGKDITAIKAEDLKPFFTEEIK